MGGEIDTADHVLHMPTGEVWVVAYVRGDRLAWCGWPPGEVQLADCYLAQKAKPAERRKLLRQMAKTTGDPRGEYARDRLERERGVGKRKDPQP